jgi:hypothetical protein
MSGNPTSSTTRLFGRGQLLPTRLRVLPRFGITLIGRTRWPYPRAERWQGYWARIDKDGNALFETCYDLGSNFVLNDIAQGESENTLIAGTEGDDPRVNAVHMRINDDGNPLWAAAHVAPPEIAFYASAINILLNRGDDFIAAGYFMQSSSQIRPWLLRLAGVIPQPVWEKQYMVTDIQSPLVSSFYGLLFMSDDVIVAGGDMFRRRPVDDVFIVDRSPCLAVSETGLGVDPPLCSVPVDIAIETPRVPQMFGGMGMDRMPMNDEDFTGATTQYVMRVDTICEATP